MNSEIKAVLNKLEENGYEAYIVGGYVRDKLLGIESNDIDICTNALPKEIMRIFNISSNLSTYGVHKIITNHYNFDITTYRMELSYNNRKPVEIKYIDNLIDDLQRRDFTINTICMNSKGDIIDLLNGMNDFNNKIIKVVGDADKKIKEDPLRILRALRFSIILNFKLDENLKKCIKKNIKLLSTLSFNRKREELDKILVSKNVIHGIKLLKKMNVLKYLGITYHRIIYVDDISGMYAQLNISNEYNFNKMESENISVIKNIIKSKKINNETLFNNGLYLSQVAGKILGIKEDRIIDMYNKLIIKNKNELAINGEDIITILNIIPSNTVNNILKDLIYNVLNGNLKNEKNELICYIINNKRKWLSNE